ncbi:MAG: 2'-5' RNA ligase family protein [Streptosporangiaceae bacterium]
MAGRWKTLRARWDPVMAGQIAAHVTLIYPEEVPIGTDLERLAESAATGAAQFTIALGPAFYIGSPAEGVFLRVHDRDGGIEAFRAAVIPPDLMIGFPPHVTIVHPRTSTRGRQAWDELASTHFDTRFTITHVAIIAFDGDRWQSVRRLPLAAHQGSA